MSPLLLECVRRFQCCEFAFLVSVFSVAVGVEAHNYYEERDGLIAVIAAVYFGIVVICHSVLRGSCQRYGAEQKHSGNDYGQCLFQHNFSSCYLQFYSKSKLLYHIKTYNCNRQNDNFLRMFYGVSHKKSLPQSQRGIICA